MMRVRTLLTGILLAALTVWVNPFLAPAESQTPTKYEVWVIDQADASRGGARLYIYDGPRLESGQAGSPEVITLDAAASGVGDGPGVRPHVVLFNTTFTHAIIANVASGHVYLMRAADRKIVASIDVGEQAHSAYPSPDGTLILVANQNGKRLARIRADFSAERFSYNRAEDLDLGALQDAAHPDNAPICPVLFAGGRAYVTLRGGGLYIVDYASVPMLVVKSYTKDQVGASGCGGVLAGTKVYVNSGSATSSDIYVFDAASHNLRKHLNLSWSGADGHGMVVTGGGRFVWMANRADRNVVVINTTVDSLGGFIADVGAAPDLMDISPNGRFVFATLRGPNNLTGGPTAKGERSGLAVIQVTDGGRNGRLATFIPIGDQTPASPNDTHGVAVRPLR